MQNHKVHAYKNRSTPCHYQYKRECTQIPQINLTQDMK